MKLLTARLFKLIQDPLHRNSFFLILSTFVMAVFGFIYWLVVARFYPPEIVGLATAVFSLATLLSNLSTFGLKTGIIHYLPQTKSKNILINTIFLFSVVLSTTVTLISFQLLRYVAPQLAIALKPVSFAISFIIFVVFSSLSTIIEGVFAAYRSVQFTLLKNALLSFTKLFLPVFFISQLTFGIFTAWNLALMLAVVVSIYNLSHQFSFKLHPGLNFNLLKTIGKFSILSHFSNFFASLPTLILPIIMTNFLSANDIAYYYMDMMIVNTIYIIPLAVGQSLFVEGSYGNANLMKNFNKAAILVFSLVIPVITLIMFFGSFILSIFGHSYGANGSQLLMLLSLSAIPVSIYSLCQSILNIKHQLVASIMINFVGFCLIFALTYFFASLKLTGIGYAWLIGNTVMAAMISAVTFKILVIKPTVEVNLGYQLP
jgi:O-antigen/teichoic acid export membrane protein